MAMTVTSPAFDSGSEIPERYSKPGGNEQPELHIRGVPSEARELAIICHDPDAPVPTGFTHWTLYGIPADTRQIPADADARFRPGPNDYGETGWGGPQPPPGHGPHHYFFWVYALDTPVAGTPERDAFLRDHAAHVVEQSRLVGIYER